MSIKAGAKVTHKTCLSTPNVSTENYSFFLNASYENLKQEKLCIFVFIAIPCENMLSLPNRRVFGVKNMEPVWNSVLPSVKQGSDPYFVRRNRNHATFLASCKKGWLYCWVNSYLLSITIPSFLPLPLTKRKTEQQLTNMLFPNI